MQGKRLLYLGIGLPFLWHCDEEIREPDNQSSFLTGIYIR